MSLRMESLRRAEASKGYDPIYRIEGVDPQPCLGKLKRVSLSMGARIVYLTAHGSI